MANNLKICSFNCKNAKTSLDELRMLCSFNDIIVLQETWLLDSEIQYLSIVDDMFYSKGISSMDTSVKIHQGRPHGGLGILWKKSLGENCNIVDMCDTRIMALDIKIDDISLLVVNIYMPCDTSENTELFQEYLSKIDLIFETCNTPYIYVLGDFNANLQVKEGGIIYSRFW